MQDTLKLKYSSENDLTIDTRNCAILGSNGSGKSSLSRRFLELNDKDLIQFLSAQRNLVFKQGSLKGQEDDNLERGMFGFQTGEGGKMDNRHIGRFTTRGGYNNTIQDDFNENLERLHRDHMNKHAFASMKHSEGEFERPMTKADKIFDVRNNVFVDRKIGIDEDGRIKVSFCDETGERNEKYEIENLSDGERSALYLITKCVYAPDNGVIIVDEGESHLNSALLNELWDQIECARNDCRFVYMSHDIDFIISRNDCTKFWIKNFNHPESWEIEKLDNEELPEELILQIIGSKKQKVLFVESKEDKDKLLYQCIYPNFKVIPVGSCINVINFTKSLNKVKQNYHKEYFGLIDRDFKNEDHVQALQEEKIFCLPVAEHENIFFRQEVIKFLFDYLGKGSDFEKEFANLKKGVFALVKDSSFKKGFYQHYTQQKFNRKLQEFELSESFSYHDDYTEINEMWEAIAKEEDYNKFLQVLNAKSIKGKVHLLDLSYDWKNYKAQILNIFNTDSAGKLRDLYMSFMPKIC